MRSLLAAAFVLALGSAALAEDCRYYSRTGEESIAVIDSDTLATDFIGGEPGDTCDYAPMDTGEFLAACGDWETRFLFVASAPNGDDDILVFNAQPWYRYCQPAGYNLTPPENFF
jgi:hypothetical protein